jgi:hypothetical protein
MGSSLSLSRDTVPLSHVAWDRLDLVGLAEIWIDRLRIFYTSPVMSSPENYCQDQAERKRVGPLQLHNEAIGNI